MKQKCKGGDEWDLVTGWRKVTNNNWKKIKTKMNKRFRKEGKQTIKKDTDYEDYSR